MHHCSGWIEKHVRRRLQLAARKSFDLLFSCFPRSCYLKDHQARWIPVAPTHTESLAELVPGNTHTSATGSIKASARFLHDDDDDDDRSTKTQSFPLETKTELYFIDRSASLPNQPVNNGCGAPTVHRGGGAPARRGGAGVLVSPILRRRQRQRQVCAYVLRTWMEEQVRRPSVLARLLPANRDVSLSCFLVLLY
jgi:hypothetical protein